MLFVHTNISISNNFPLSKFFILGSQPFKTKNGSDEIEISVEEREPTKQNMLTSLEK